MRPKSGGMELEVAPFEPTVVELFGDDAERFELTINGRGRGVKRLSTDVELSMNSTDGGCYTLGEQIWRSDGRGDGNYTLGYVERLLDGEWQPYYTLSDCTPRAAMFTGAARDLIAPKNSGYCESFVVNLPYWEPGHYRAVFTARDYIPREDADPRRINEYGRSGEKTCKFWFEYDVPERTDAPFDLLFADLRQAEEFAALTLTLRANTAARYIQPDATRLERFDEQSRSWVAAESALARDNRRVSENFIYAVDSEKSNAAENISALSPRGDDYRLDLIPLSEIGIDGVERGENYRLILRFTEHPDGSGEWYTLTLRLRFSE